LRLAALGLGPEKHSPVRGAIPYIVEESVRTVVSYIVVGAVS
jgi:hypothetical protein